MNGKAKLSRRRIITIGFNSVVAALLALVLLYMITPFFHLSGALRYTIMIILCIVMSVVVSLKPRWVITTICILVLFIGVTLLSLAQNKEIASQIAWDPSMLGAGASIVALAITFYMLLIQIRPREEAIQLTDGERHISYSKKNAKKGYVWLENTKKYRCEYCLYLGKYHYCKTLGGIKRHIAREHE